MVGDCGIFYNLKRFTKRARIESVSVNTNLKLSGLGTRDSRTYLHTALLIGDGI